MIEWNRIYQNQTQNGKVRHMKEQQETEIPTRHEGRKERRPDAQKNGSETERKK